jgi:hypothetical protein
MAKAFIQESTLTDIADAIRGKLGVSTQYLPSEMADAIESIPSGGGGGAVEKKDVNFYDYDGTLLYSYTAAEALALEAMPDLPDHIDISLQSDGSELVKSVQNGIADISKNNVAMAPA